MGGQSWPDQNPTLSVGMSSVRSVFRCDCFRCRHICWTQRPLLLLLILGMLTNKWAPISAGLVLVLGTARILDFLKRRLLRQRDNRRPSLIAMAVGFAAGGLSRAALYVSVGIGLVACVQFALWAHSQSITPEEALRGEQYLASIFPTVSNILSLRDYLAFLSVCVLVNLVLPFSGLVHKVLYIRSALSVLVFILIGVLSFSFFASDSAKFQITEWRKAEYAQARLALDDIKKINRETMAALWLEKQVKQADPATTEDYKPSFRLWLFRGVETASLKAKSFARLPQALQTMLRKRRTQ